MTRKWRKRIVEGKKKEKEKLAAAQELLKQHVKNQQFFNS